MSTDQRRAAFRVFTEIRLPQAQHSPPTGAHVGVLRSVQGYATTDPRLDAVPLPVVPVVAVKLHDEASRGDRRVWDELPVERLLPKVGNPEAIEQCVAVRLGPRHAPALARRVHGDQPRPPFEVRVPAWQRAIGRVVPAAGCAARRPAERGAAHLADVVGLVPRLVCLAARLAAEPGAAPTGLCIEPSAAPSAGLVGAPLPLWTRRSPIALDRAKPRPGAHPPRDDAAASGTSDRADTVALNALRHIRKSTATVSRVKVMR